MKSSDNTKLCVEEAAHEIQKALNNIKLVVEERVLELKNA
jgi:hypothetical protein